MSEAWPATMSEAWSTVMAEETQESSSILEISRPFPKIDLFNESDVQLFFTAVRDGDYEFIESWVEHKLPLNVRDFKGNTVLHEITNFSKYGRALDPIYVRYLLEKGVNPSIRNLRGENPLHLFVRTHNRLDSVVIDLVKWGARVDSKDKKKRTVLHLAVYYGKFGYIPLLLRLGSDVNALDELQFTPSDFIRQELEVNYFMFKKQFRGYNRVFKIELELIEPVDQLIKHVMKMEALDFYVRDETKKHTSVLKSWLSLTTTRMPMTLGDRKLNISGNDAIELSCLIKVEARKLKETLIDENYNVTAYDLMTKSDDEMARLLNKSVFRRYFEERRHKMDFPMYWDFLELKYDEGFVRLIVRSLARSYLRSLFRLPDHCLDLILDGYLTREELDQFVRAMFTIASGIRRSISQILQLRASRMKITRPMLTSSGYIVLEVADRTTPPKGF